MSILDDWIVYKYNIANEHDNITIMVHAVISMEGASLVYRSVNFQVKV